MVLQLKRGVRTEGVQAMIWFALGVAQEIYRALRKPLVVTSLTDSHAKRPKSLHNKGLGADLRTRHLTAPQVCQVHADLEAALGPLGFDVVLETDHIHIEYDPKQGEAWLREGAS